MSHDPKTYEWPLGKAIPRAGRVVAVNIREGTITIETGGSDEEGKRREGRQEGLLTRADA